MKEVIIYVTFALLYFLNLKYTEKVVLKIFKKDKSTEFDKGKAVGYVELLVIVLLFRLLGIFD